MGIYDRDYVNERFQSSYSGTPRMRIGFPRITPVVKWLLIINVVVFFVQIMFTPASPHQVGPIEKWFAVYPLSWVSVLQLWRVVTYQFLHGSPIHIMFNMIALYFLGPTLERYWGDKRFLMFYLGCGAVGGLVYPLLLWIGVISPHPVYGPLPMVGASGAILGMLAACAILFPQFIVFLFFFPVPIRVAAVIIAALAVMGLLTGKNAGGEAAHLAGLAAGAGYVLYRPWLQKLKVRTRTGRWENKMARRRERDMELDRILDKIHHQGISSLTRKERKILQQATREEQMRERM